MSRPLPRYTKDPDPHKVTRILAEAGADQPKLIIRGTAGGDHQRLRGIPAIGKGVTGHIPGTRPDQR